MASSISKKECQALLLLLLHALPVGHTSPESDLWHAFDLEVSATILVGGRLGFSPGELVDFLAGLLGFDPIEDDWTPPPGEK